MGRTVFRVGVGVCVALTTACPAGDDGGGSSTGVGSGATATTGEAETGSATATSGAATTTATTAPGSTGSATSTGADESTAGVEPPKFDLGELPDLSDPPLVPTDIDVVLTADNAYAFGYGTEGEMLNYFGGVTALSAGDIFSCATGPEQYTVPAADVAEYLYIVAYGDTATTQGVLGQFRRVSDMPDGTPGDVVYTGADDWEVCATGVDYNSGDPTPTLQVVNEQIAICNAGTGDPATTSGGWVDAVGTPLGALAAGETNETPYAGGPQPGNEFPLVCQAVVDAEARWMWFNWDPATILWPVQSPFIYPGGGGNPMHDFMIFRLASSAVPQPPAG